MSNRRRVGWRVFKCKKCGSLFSYRGKFIQGNENKTGSYCGCYSRGYYHYYETYTFWEFEKDIPEGLRGKNRFEELSKDEVKMLRVLYG